MDDPARDLTVWVLGTSPVDLERLFSGIPRYDLQAIGEVLEMGTAKLDKILFLSGRPFRELRQRIIRKAELHAVLLLEVCDERKDFGSLCCRIHPMFLE